MAKTKISEFSATPGNNTDIDGINIAEGCAPSGINDAIRELMSQLKDFQTGAAGDSFNGPVGSTTPAAGAFTTLTSNGATTLGDAVGDVITINGTVTYANANPTYSAGTANGVGYLNGSKQFTTGSALTFDGAGNFFNSASGAGYWLSAAGTYVMGLYQNGTSLTFRTNTTGQYTIDNSGNSIWSPGGTEQMRLTSTGLGIGTSSPGAKLDVVGNATVSGGITSSGGDITVGTAGKFLYSNYVSQNSGNSLFLRGAGASGQIEFQTNTTTKATLDSSGNLGLGVTPSAWASTYKAFQVLNVGRSLAATGAGAGDLTLAFNAIYSSANSRWDYAYTGDAAVRYSQTGAGIHAWYNAPSGNAGDPISFTQAMTLTSGGNLLLGGTTDNARVNIQAGGSLGQFLIAYNGTSTNYYDADTQIFRSANATERARIDSSGNWLLGLTAQTNTPANGIVAQNLTSTSQFLIGHSNGSGSGTYYEAYFYNSTNIGSVTQNGTTGVLYNITSDYRLKDVVGAVTGSGERIDALKPVNYTWKANGSAARGFLAHEFQEVYASSVTGTKDAVDEEGNPIYQQMQAGTTEVIADLVAEIQSLRKRLAALEGK